MSDEVTIFTKPGCPYCAAAKEDFRRRQVAFSERDVVSDRRALEQMLSLNGGKRLVPTIVEGGQTRVGFNGA